MDEEFSDDDSPMSSLSGSPEKSIRNRTFEYLNNERNRVSSRTDRYLDIIGFNDDNSRLIDISIDSSREDSDLINIYPLENSNDINNNDENESISLIDENTINSRSTLFWYEIDLYLEERKSLFSYSFMFLNLVFFIYGLIKNGGYFLKTCPDEEILFYDGISNWPKCEDQRSQLWRFITSTLTHNGIYHIFFNLLVFAPYSISLESVQKSSYLFFIYLLTTVHSSTIFFIQNPYISVIGCSNIVYSFIGAFISNLILNLDYYSINSNLIYLSIFPTLFLIFFEIIGYIFHKSESTAYICHWIGFLSGLLGGFSIFKIFFPKNYKMRIRLISRILYFIMTITLIFYYVSIFPPLVSYDEFFNIKETIDCCYEWFNYKDKNNVSDDYFKNFTCPYIVEYTDMYIKR